jgi:hypothetical protein
VISFHSTSTGQTGISVAKATVDKLLKGYDIRLRPDFGGMCDILYLPCAVPETETPLPLHQRCRLMVIIFLNPVEMLPLEQQRQML